MKSITLIFSVLLFSISTFASYDCLGEYKIATNSGPASYSDIKVFESPSGVMKLEDGIFKLNKLNGNKYKLTILSASQPDLKISTIGDFDTQEKLKVTHNTSSELYRFTCFKKVDPKLNCTAYMIVGNVEKSQALTGNAIKIKTDIDHAYYMVTKKTQSTYWMMITLGPTYTTGGTAVVNPDRNNALNYSLSKNGVDYSIACKVVD